MTQQATRRARSVFVLVAITTAFLPVAGATARAQDDRETLVRGSVDHSLSIEPETKFSSIDVEFANFTGMTVTLGMNDRFHVGVGGFGLTNQNNVSSMGYGGLVVGYRHRPRKLLHLSAGGLLGAGNVDFRGGGSRTLFVAEPEAKLSLNVTNLIRLDFGVGYRFVANAGDDNAALSGLSGSFGVAFELFRD